jgi:virginiamycin B lyase
MVTEEALFHPLEDLITKLNRMFASIITIIVGFSIMLPLASAQAGEKPDAYIREVAIPRPHLGPLAILYDQGSVWFTLDGSNALGVFYPVNGSFVTYDVPFRPQSPVSQYGMEGIAMDRNGMIWFTHSSTSRIVRFDPKSQNFSGTVVGTNASAFRLLADNSGNIWYTDIRNNKIGVLALNGSNTQFDLPTQKSGPAGLTFDLSGKIWFTETFAKKVGVFDPKTRTVTEFSPPRDYMNSPVGIAVGQDGMVWVADHGGSEIIRFDPKANSWRKFVTSKPPPEIYPIALPNDITIDKQGNLWVTEHAGNKIARFDPRTELLTEYIIPSSPAITLWLALDEGGGIWFAEAQAGKIGRLDPSKSPPFSLVLSADTITVPLGGRASLSANISFSRSTTPVTVSTYGLPVTMKAVANISAQADNFQKSDIQVFADHSTDEGTYYLSISAGDGKVQQTRTVMVKVEANRSQQPTGLLYSVIIVTIIIAGVVVAVMLFRRMWR